MIAGHRIGEAADAIDRAGIREWDGEPMSVEHSKDNP
jgi:hypothetical protein